MSELSYQQKYHLINRDKLNARTKAFHLRRRQEHPSFINWQCMMWRCYNKKHNRYRFYGARGIEVIESWHEFSEFEKDFGYSKPRGDYTIDRIDNDSDYTLGNVRWQLRKDNKIHKRKI